MDKEFNFSVADLNTAMKKEDEEAKKMTEEAKEKSQMKKESVVQTRKALKKVEEESKSIEDAQKKVYENRIRRRCKYFPDVVEEITPSFNNKVTLIELKAIDELQISEIASHEAEKRLIGYFMNGCMLMESMWGNGKAMNWCPQNLRMDLTGLSRVGVEMSNRKDFADLVKETIIEHPSIASSTVEFRWIQLIFGTLLMVNNINKNPQFAKLANEKPAETPSEFSDVKSQ